MLAVFFGRTPMSLGEDPVPADRVNVIGKIQGDAKVLQQAVGADHHAGRITSREERDATQYRPYSSNGRQR